MGACLPVPGGGGGGSSAALCRPLRGVPFEACSSPREILMTRPPTTHGHTHAHAHAHARTHTHTHTHPHGDGLWGAAGKYWNGRTPEEGGTPPPLDRLRPLKTVQSAEGGKGKDKRERIIVVVRRPCQENYPADAHPTAHKSVLESANPRMDSERASGCPWSTARATARLRDSPPPE